MLVSLRGTRSIRTNLVMNACMAKNSYENAGAISLGMTSEQAAKRRVELARVSTRLRLFSVVPIRVCHPKSSLMKASEICSSFESRAMCSTMKAWEASSIGRYFGRATDCRARPSELRCRRRRNENRCRERQSTRAYSVTCHRDQARSRFDPKGDLETMIKANVKHVVDGLRSSTPILKAKVDSGDVQVIGGYYTLDTGALLFSKGSKTSLNQTA